MTETTNFGLKKPEETDFYSVDTQNDNMDVIDSVLQEFKDGTQQVGDSAKLGGKDASKYITGDEELRTSILEKALTLSKGVYNYHFNSTPSDLPVDSYKYGSATIFVRKENAILVVLWGINVSSTPIATNFYNGTEWSGWSKYVTLADLANYLPLSGGMVGNKNNNRAFKVQGAAAPFIEFFNSNDAKMGAIGFFSTGSLGVELSDGTQKNILHTGNKPTGTYTGNGDSTARVVETNAINPVYVVVEVGTNNFAVVTSTGYIGKKDNVIALGTQIAAVSNGIKIVSDTVFNTSGVTYRYYSL